MTLEEAIAPDLPLETFEEVYRRLLRALRRKKGFGLFFVVQSDYAQGNQIIEQVRKDLSQKKIAVLEIERKTQTLYDKIAELKEKEPFDILFLRGIENALYEYEDTKRLSGWTEEEIYAYSWKGVPPILSHLNQQRERFSQDFPCSFVFFAPSFAIDYFIQRAPDFFDWRSGMFHFPLTEEELHIKAKKLLADNLEECLKLTAEERVVKTLEIKDLILESGNNPDKSAKLLLREGWLFFSGNQYNKALASWDKVLKIDPDNYVAWSNRGLVLLQLERYEQAVESFDKVVELKPDNYRTWNTRGMMLMALGRYEEALANFEQAIALNLDSYEAWQNRGVALEKLQRYEEALASFEQAIALKADDYNIWQNRGVALEKLQRYQEALASFEQAISLKADDYDSWQYRGIVLGKLQRHEEAIEAYKKAIYLEPKFIPAYHGLTLIYYKQGLSNLAIELLTRGIELNPQEGGILLNNLGFIYLTQNKLEKARSCLNRSIQIDSNYFLPIFNLGLVHVLKGKIKEAKRLIQKSLKCCDREDTQEKLCFAIGTIVLGNKQEGLENLQETLSTLTHPSDIDKIRCGVLESAEILARYPSDFPGIDQALAMLKQTLQNQ